MAKKYKYDTKKNGKNATGRPSDYRPEYCQQMIDYFSVEPNNEVLTSRGRERFANKLPAFHHFASTIGVCHDTLLEWCKHYPEFSEAYKKSKELQKFFLIENALNGLYNPTAFIFISKNITDMRDKQEIEHSGSIASVDLASMSTDELRERYRIMKELEDKK